VLNNHRIKPENTIIRGSTMNITDAERTKEVHIPCELLESVGVFKDMTECCPAMKDDEPVWRRHLHFDG
jgi:hypothetical protein